MNTNQLTEDIKKALSEQVDLTKASFTQSTGLVQYNLEAPAKQLVPVITPLRNDIPRVKTVGGTQANWKAITAFDTANQSLGVTEGHRGANLTPQVTPYSASFVGLGLESSFTWEAEYAGEGFDDVRARNSQNLLLQFMIKEEQAILGGQGTFGLGVTPTPVIALASGGTMTAQAVNVYCVALTLDGFLRSSVAAGLPGQFTRTNAGGTTDTINGGNAQVSAASNTVTTTGGTLSVTATVAAVKGAAAYAWYVGNTAATAGLAAITTVNAVTISANAAGTQKANDAKIAADYSADNTVFDGLLAQCAKSGSNAYFSSLDNGTFTADGGGGIVEIDTMLQDRWDNYRLSPDVLYVNSQEAKNIAKKVISNGGAPLYRINGSDGAVQITAGSVVGGYLNKFALGTGQVIPIKIHPFLPAGTVLGFTHQLPYPLTNVNNLVQMKLRRDYFQQEWPQTNRQVEYGIYEDGVLQHYFPASMAVIANIKNG